MKHPQKQSVQTTPAQTPLGQLLLRGGVLTEEQLNVALKQQECNDERKLIGEVLVDMGFVDDRIVLEDSSLF